MSLFFILKQGQNFVFFLFWLFRDFIATRPLLKLTFVSWYLFIARRFLRRISHVWDLVPMEKKNWLVTQFTSDELHQNQPVELTRFILLTRKAVLHSSRCSSLALSSSLSFICLRGHYVCLNNKLELKASYS